MTTAYASDDQLNALVALMTERLNVTTDNDVRTARLLVIMMAGTALAHRAPETTAILAMSGLTYADPSGKCLNAVLPHTVMELVKTPGVTISDPRALSAPLEPQEVSSLMDWLRTQPVVRRAPEPQQAAPQPVVRRAPEPQQAAPQPVTWRSKLAQVAKAVAPFVAVYVAASGHSGGRQQQPLPSAYMTPPRQPVYHPQPQRWEPPMGYHPTPLLPITSDPRFWCPQLWNR